MIVYTVRIKATTLSCCTCTTKRTVNSHFRQVSDKLYLTHSVRIKQHLLLNVFQPDGPGIGRTPNTRTETAHARHAAEAQVTHRDRQLPTTVESQRKVFL